MDAAIDIAARISGATTDIATRVTGAIRDAARVTGAGFEYLLNTALRESNLNPNAKAKTSSATGSVPVHRPDLARHDEAVGRSLGYGKYADAITKTSSGTLRRFNDPAMRRQIMALRKDPTANAVMAGAFANSNAKVLTERLGRKPNDGELYMAHFLGASGAARFIRAAEARPNATAANYVPRAAAANSSIFYDKQGGAKSLKQVYAGLVARHNVIGTQLADADAANATKPADPVKSATRIAATTPAPVPALPLAFFQDVPASSANASAVAPVSATAAMAAINAATVAAPASPAASAPLVAEAKSTSMSDRPQTPTFQSLYQSDERGPVGPVVRELWGARRAAVTETPSAVAPAADSSANSGASINAPLDLFQFLRPTIRRPA